MDSEVDFFFGGKVARLQEKVGRSEVIFSQEVHAAENLIREGVSVHIGEVIGGGPDAFHAVIESLGRQHYQVFRIRCSSSTASLSLAALRLSDVWHNLSLGDSATILQIVEGLSDLVSSQLRVVLAIENVEHVDTVTWAVLEAVYQRTQITIVTVGKRLAEAKRRGLKTIAEFVSPWQEVSIDTLSFHGVGSLASKLLGGVPSQELVRSLYNETQGYYFLSAALIDTCRRDRTIVKRGKEWTRIGKLWNPQLIGYLESFIEDKSAVLREPLSALAVLGKMEVEVFRRKYSVEILQELERERLVLFHGTGKDRVMEVSPPVLRRYLSTSISPHCKQDIIETFVGDHGDPQGLLDPSVPYADRLRSETWPEYHAVLQRPRIEEVAFAESMRREWRSRYERESRLWRERPSLETGVPLLRTVILWEGAKGEIDELLLALGEYGGTSAAAGEVGGTALERCYLKDENADTSGFAIELAARFPQYGHAFEAEALFLDATFCSQTEVTEPLSTWAKGNDEYTGIANAFRDAIAGVSVQGLGSLVPNMPEVPAAPFDQRARRAKYLTYGLGMFAGGKVVESTGWALDRLSDALAAGDYQLIVQHTYVASLGLYMMGRIDDVVLLSDAVFASEPPGAYQLFLYGALLQLNAVIAFRKGQTLVALRFVDHFESMSLRESSIAGLADEISGSIRLLSQGEMEKAVALMAAGIERCLQRGWVLAAFHLALVAADLGLGTLLRGRDPWREVKERVSPALSLLLDLSLSIQTADAEGTSALGEQFLSLDAEYFAAVSYEASIRVLLGQGDLAGVAAIEVLREASQLPTSHYSFGLALQKREDDTALTPREEELAAHATRGTQEIARMFSLSPRTVENHLHRAMKKLRVSNRKELENAVLSIRGQRKSIR